MRFNKYNNTCHSTIKMKSVDVKPSTYIASWRKIYYQHPKFNIGDMVRISKYKSIFAKCYVLIWSEEFFVIKKARNTVLWTYVASDLKGKEIVATFYKKELQKLNQKDFRIENVVKRKGDKLYVNRKGCNFLTAGLI